MVDEKLVNGKIIIKNCCKEKLNHLSDICRGIGRGSLKALEETPFKLGFFRHSVMYFNIKHYNYVT